MPSTLVVHPSSMSASSPTMMVWVWAPSLHTLPLVTYPTLNQYLFLVKPASKSPWMTFFLLSGPGTVTEGTSPLRLAEESAGTGASVQSAFGLQFPGDEVQQLAGRIMAELPLHRQECAHGEQQAWNSQASP